MRSVIGDRIRSAAAASPPRTHPVTVFHALDSQLPPIGATASDGLRPAAARPSRDDKSLPSASAAAVSAAVEMRAGSEKSTNSGPSSPTIAQPPECRPPSANLGISALAGKRVLIPIAEATLLNTPAMPSFHTVLMTQLIGLRNLFATFRQARSMPSTASLIQPAMFSTPRRKR